MVTNFQYSNSFIKALSRVFSEKRSAYNGKDNDRDNCGDVLESITNAPPEVRKIIEQVLEAEKDKLYMKIPKFINDDILKIIKQEVQ